MFHCVQIENQIIYGIPCCLCLFFQLKDSDISKEVLLFHFVLGARFHRASVNGRANLSLFHCPCQQCSHV